MSTSDANYPNRIQIIPKQIPTTIRYSRHPIRDIPYRFERFDMFDFVIRSYLSPTSPPHLPRTECCEKPHGRIELLQPEEASKPELVQRERWCSQKRRKYIHVMSRLRGLSVYSFLLPLTPSIFALAPHALALRCRPLLPFRPTGHSLTIRFAN